MEINRFEDVLGVIPQADVVEGRFVVLTTNAMTGDFVNVDDDLPGAVVPATAELATRAKYCITFAVDNRPTPIVDHTTTPWSTRGGWGTNPWTQGPLTGLTMYLTHPGNQESQTIPSGYKSLAFTDGTFTIPSGQYIDNANLHVPGAAVIVANTAEDGAGSAGMPKYQATVDARVIGYVYEYNSSTGALTIRVE